ncbi:YdcF family protein, partial [Nocardiopsis lucentensis]|uniref:YdcF family protein n=1 Tax=Nocardiopsis lucentensis TaxID=53441 RepID=UPI00035CF9E5
EPDGPRSPTDGNPGRGTPIDDPTDPRGDGPGDGRGPRRGRSRPAPPRRRKRRRLRVRWLIALVLLALLALPPGTWAWVWYTARQDDRAATDAIIVLGASQYNGVPSEIFEARLRHAQSLYQSGVAPVIVTVGGKQPADNYTEAASGRNWLVEVGVPAEQVIAVEEGRDTLQSIRAVSEVFEDNGWETATLVSDPWHSLRSQRMAHDHGIEAGTSPARSGPAVIERRTQLWYITRETMSLWYYWIFSDSSDIRVDAA